MERRSLFSGRAILKFVREILREKLNKRDAAVITGQADSPDRAAELNDLWQIDMKGHFPLIRDLLLILAAGMVGA